MLVLYSVFTGKASSSKENHKHFRIYAYTSVRLFGKIMGFKFNFSPAQTGTEKNDKIKIDNLVFGYMRFEKEDIHV